MSRIVVSATFGKPFGQRGPQNFLCFAADKGPDVATGHCQFGVIFCAEMIPPREHDTGTMVSPVA